MSLAQPDNGKRESVIFVMPLSTIAAANLARLSLDLPGADCSTELVVGFLDEDYVLVVGHVKAPSYLSAIIPVLS
jgi:hypothetical protein